MGEVYSDARRQVLNVAGSITGDGVIETGGHPRNRRGLEQEEDFKVSLWHDSSRL